MSAYYNEIDPHAAQWLRNLIAAGLIAPGDVDERSIADVRPDDLAGYGQCHFFAGIGGWSYALRLAEWPDSRPVWTGSCPCQPFSAAGAGKAADDERHLWPRWFPLIAERRPAIVFGEQVEAAIGWGWLDAVFADLEGEGYACGSAVLPACGVGAPHIRQRCWFLADTDGSRRQSFSHVGRGERAGDGAGKPRAERLTCVGGKDGGLADALPAGRPQGRPVTGDRPAAGRGIAGELGHANGTGSQGRREYAGEYAGQRSPWAASALLPCTDGKARPVESGTFPLAHGIPGRVGRLRAYGNAIVPQVAAEFVSSYMEIA